MALKCLQTATAILRRCSTAELLVPRKTFLPQNMTLIRECFRYHFIHPNQYDHLTCYKSRLPLLSPRKTFLPQNMTSIRGSFVHHFLPPSQYDHPGSYKFHFPEILIKNWELIPLFGSVAVCMAGIVFNVIWACMHKVDVVFRTHSRANISRTMNLCAPTVHKLITIEQEYRPWPQMARVLLMMKEEQVKRAEACRS